MARILQCIVFITIFVATQVCETKCDGNPGLLKTMPSGCSGKSFCFVKHAEYPQEKVNSMISDLKLNLTHNRYLEHSGRAQEDPGDYQTNVTITSDPDASLYGKDGYTEDEGDDCETYITRDLIYEILDDKDQVRIVLQSENLFMQSVRLEWCLTPGRLLKHTIHLDAHELASHNIFCENQIIYFSFLVLTPDGEGVEAVRNKGGIPIGCDVRIHDR